jgi:hypothetical protein
MLHFVDTIWLVGIRQRKIVGIIPSGCHSKGKYRKLTFTKNFIILFLHTRKIKVRYSTRVGDETRLVNDGTLLGELCVFTYVIDPRI